VRFTLLDSAGAMIDPLVYDWLDEWLAAGGNETHVVAMHIPPRDPSGTRNGGFASRNEAAKLLNRFQSQGVDLTLYGHIHTYISFDNAGIPAFISGGGGAIPNRGDGIGRHFMVIEVDAKPGVTNTCRVEVDGDWDYWP
jgi:3',5'-cyclic-AMP phosphodiesterase